MKKKLCLVLGLVLALGIFTACGKKDQGPVEENTTTNETQDEIENKEENIENQEEKPEEEEPEEEETQGGTFILASGEEIAYENFQVLAGGSLAPVELTVDQEEKILEKLELLSFSNSKEVLKTKNNEKTIVIKLSPTAYIEMREEKPYYEDNLFHYNYFKDGDLVDVLVSEEDLREDIRSIIENKTEEK